MVAIHHRTVVDEREQAVLDAPGACDARNVRRAIGVSAQCRLGR
jgi:hypothetical protein